MSKSEPLQQKILIPDQVQVFEDGKTKAKSVAFPFTFPDGTAGVLIVSRISRAPWQPIGINNITITYEPEV